MTVRLQAYCFRFATFILMFAASVAFAEEAASTDDGKRFVAVGQLARVRTSSDGDSRFVLLDEQGQVISSLRAAAGLDLAEHIGEDVGVTARTLVDSDTPILLAESVTTFGEARQLSTDDFGKHVALASHEDEFVASSEIMPTPMAVAGVPSISEYPITNAPLISDGFATDGYATDGYFVGSDRCGIAGCDSCGGGCGNVACKSCAACPCGLPGRFWIRSEYLIWWTKGMDTPPLLVSSPSSTSRRNAGVHGIPGNQTLYGGEILADSRSGGRFRIGKWCDRCNWVGFETDFFFLGDEDQNFAECSINNGIIGRPYTSTVDGATSQLIDFPGVVIGNVHIDADTSLWSINPRLRVNLSCERFPGCNPRRPCDVGGYRFDLLVGYRFMNLDDSLSIREEVVSPSDPNALLPRFDQVQYFNLRDAFTTSNDFHGADIGFSWEGYKGPWSLELLGKVGIGSTSQNVTINGTTTRTVNGNAFTDPGGLLALDPNIGSYSRDEFTVLPEVSATLGYALSPRTRFLVGYTFIYWDNVVRAGDQIDTTLNEDFFPDARPTTGPNRPEFSFVDTGFWAQGVSLGLEYRW